MSEEVFDNTNSNIKICLYERVNSIVRCFLYYVSDMHNHSKVSMSCASFKVIWLKEAHEGFS